MTGAWYAGADAQVKVVALTEDGREVSVEDLQLKLTSSDEEIFSVEGTTVSGKRVGNAQLNVEASLAGVAVSASIPVQVEAPVLAELVLSAKTTVMKPDAEGIQITAAGIDNLGAPVSLDGVAIHWSSRDSSIAQVSDSGFVTPQGLGAVYIEATAESGGRQMTGELEITVTEGKTASTFYTPEKVAAARENIETSSWARQMKNNAVKAAEKYLIDEEKLWSMFTTQELPRSMTIGYRFDPDQTRCRYCGEELMAEYTAYPWKFDIFGDPWKVQCPKCRRRFPSNDFGSFYELGIDDNGNWSYELAKERNAQLVAEGKDGYLKNILYPEKDKELGITGWGVDDGYGYKTGNVYHTSDGDIPEVHTYIAYYNHMALWCSDQGSNKGAFVVSAMETLRDAYLYTGDKKYGRLGAILVDRYADVWPDMNLIPDSDWAQCSGNGNFPRGKAVGSISERFLANASVLLYDAVYDCFEDPQVISFLSKKAEQYNLGEKDTARKLRQRAEDRILREIGEAARVRNLYGNVGMAHAAVAYAAVVLDTMPDTANMIDWIFRNGADTKTASTDNSPLEGGNITRTLVNKINPRRRRR